jgi:epoxyqueuosine reductase QueG
MNTTEIAELTQKVKETAFKSGADLVGIASIERFEGVPKEHHPCSIFPETQSVIVIGKRIARGCLRGIEEGTHFLGYHLFASCWVPDRFLALTTITTAQFIEDHRWEAVPIPNLPPQVPAMGIPVKSDSPAPNVMVNIEEAAVRAGLGQFSYSGLLMTPEFGPLQKLQMIMTDAVLAADPLCKKSICDNCKACVKACPLGAMNPAKEQTIDICGIDHKICETCKNGVMSNPYHASGLPDRVPAVCMRTCLQHLDETGLLDKKFDKPFRRRPAWQVKADGVASLVKEA